MYLITQTSLDPGRTQYQRLKHMTKKNMLFIFTGKKTKFPLFRNLTLVRSSSHFGGTNPLYVFFALFKFYQLHKTQKFDIIYSSYNYYSILPGFLLKFLYGTKVKWVVDLWDHPELQVEKEIWKRRRKDILTVILHLSEIIGVFLSKKVLKYSDLIVLALYPTGPLMKKFSLNRVPILAVTNGVDLSIVKPKHKKHEDGSFKLFYVGFVMKERGLDLMLQTLTLLKFSIKNLKLNLVGDSTPEDLAYMKETVKKNGLEEIVQYFGKLKHEQVLDLTEEADVCLFPFPRKEVLNCIYPVKIFEYMAMGKAVVATRLEGVSQIIKDGINGLLVDVEPSKMCEAILKVYQNPKLRRSLENNAMKSVRDYDSQIIHARINMGLEKLFARS